MLIKSYLHFQFGNFENVGKKFLFIKKTVENYLAPIASNEVMK